MSDSETCCLSGLEEEEAAPGSPFLRRTQRVSAGQAPERYGNWVDFTFPTRTNKNTEEKTENEKTVIENYAFTPDTTVVKTTAQAKTPFKLKCHSPSAMSFTTAKSKKATQEAEIKQKLEVLKLEDDEEEVKLAIQQAKLKRIQRQKELLKLNAALSKCQDDDHDSQKLDDQYDNVFIADPTDPAIWVSKHATPKTESNETDITSLFQQFSKTLADSIMHATKSQGAGPRNDDGIKTLLARQSGAKELPSFSGSHKEWTTFIAAFRRSTLTCKFSNDENIQRLNRALTGRAKTAVQALMVSPDNLEQILKTLERKFGNPTHIMEEMVDTIRHFPFIRDDRPYQIVDLSNEVEGLVATAKSLKKEYYLKNPILMKELVSKLPLHLSLKWGEVSYDATLDGKESDLEDFQKWLVKIAEAVSSGNIIKRFNQDKTSQPSTSFSHGKYQKPKHEAVMITREPTKKSKPCVLCNNGSHPLDKCKHFEALSIQERWNVVKEKKVCFCCLRTGQSIKLCRNKKSCGVENCQKPHHPALHETPLEKPADEEEIAVVNLSHLRPMPRVMLKIATVKVSGPKGTVITHALLDEGATATLVDNSLAQQIGLEGRNRPLKIVGARNMTYVDYSSKTVNLTISGAREPNKHVLENVKTVQDLALPSQNINVAKLKSKWRYIADLGLDDLVNATPTILIGEDNLHLIITRELVEGPKQGPIVSRTHLGWVVHGNNAEVKGRIEPDVVFLTVPTNETDDNLHELVKYFFTLESTGVKLCGDKVKPKEEARALDIMEKTTRRLEGSCHFETGLLWKDDDIRFPDTYTSALRRLYSVEKKMDQDDDYAKQYCQKIQDYIDKGYAKKLNIEEAREKSPKVRLLPHFGVINPNKKKLRIVFDAASKSPVDKKSLNDFLLAVPDFYNPLAGVLCKFRQKEVAICADIKEMFPQIKIRPDDSKSQRFLWRGMERSCQPDTYEMTSMIFGAKSSPSSAQFVNNKNAVEFQSTYPEAATAIVKHHYMDDLCDSCPTEEDAIKLAQEIIHVHAKGGFQICNWVSSSAKVLESIPENIRGQDIKSFQESQTKNERVLGIYWNPKEDMFQFTHAMHKVPKEVLDQQRAPTKRQVLQLLMSIFDPLGLLSHHTIKAKILMQKVWRSGIEWDDPIAEGLKKLWTSWLGQLEHLKTVKIPRHYSASMKLAQEIQLHVFADASEDAFAVAAYFRVKLQDAIQVAQVGMVIT